MKTLNSSKALLPEDQALQLIIAHRKLVVILEDASNQIWGSKHRDMKSLLAPVSDPTFDPVKYPNPPLHPAVSAMYLSGRLGDLYWNAPPTRKKLTNIIAALYDNSSFSAEKNPITTSDALTSAKICLRSTADPEELRVIRASVEVLLHMKDLGERYTTIQLAGIHQTLLSMRNLAATLK